MFKKDPVVEYWTSVEGLTQIEDARPTPYKNLKPEWWKKVPANTVNGTIKNCPSFSDLFASAYVLRMWCDSKITRQDNGEFLWETPYSEFSWGGHTSAQMVDYVPLWLKEKVWATGKPISPWCAKTPKGYSIYHMPVMYDANPDFVALEGVIHTDRYHSLHVPMLLFSDKDEFEIKLGTPLALHIPFKREKFSMTVSEENDRYKFLRKTTNLVSSSKFKNSYRSALKDLYKSEGY